ncbi:hypothetical protein GCM10010236_36850 [Streptomyces eurythermus]|nr:hypothetical protein GCM10010236_36850 [Streptomyces eurythermus]
MSGPRAVAEPDGRPSRRTCCDTAPPGPMRGRAVIVCQDAVQDPSVGAAELPFFMTVKPKLVEAPAARLPL